MIMLFFVLQQNSALQALFGLIAAFSPALVALLISAISRPSPKTAGTPIRWIAFAGAWLFTWAVLLLHTWRVRGVTPELQIIIPVGLVAVLPAWLVSCAYSRIPGVRELFKTLLHPRGHILWYLAAILTVPSIQIIGAGLTVLAGGEVSFEVSDMSIPAAFIFIVLTFLHGFLVSGGINEETGWRGFVLPRLQARFPVIVAVAIVWFFWALWHVPYDLGTGTPMGAILQNRILFNFVWAILFTWVYNRTGGSLLAPAIFHPAMNTFGDALPQTDAASALFLILTLAIILRERMWKKLAEDNPAVHE